MEERRKSVRTELKAELLLERIDEKRGEKININISDLSKTGIGFSCEKALKIGAVYECYLTIWTKEVLHVVIEIVRERREPDGFHYGGEFIALSDADAARISIYQTFEEYKA